ncbi:MAG: MmgE/PrpD family protein [Boseongicola sp. SB0675_bin_26]|nr:MmgE/PrpD family protein [Boseongicola sp. SB0675_bin_26]
MNNGENGSVERDVADYIAGALEAEIPASVLARARCHLLDTLAAIISGRNLPAGDFGFRLASESGVGADATLLGTSQQVSLECAAFANAMAAHAGETDDSHVRGRFHPGCAVVPAALAVAERFDTSGKDLLKAIVLGYDIGARSTIALGFSNPRTTAISTHSFGALFGAAASSGALMGLTPFESESLLSVTVQQASGLSYWNRDPDHIEKSFDFGAKAARNGVFAAMLAKAGMTAPSLPLTGENGYLAAYAEVANPAALADELGTRFEIEGATIKKWSAGSPIQSVLDAVEAIFGGKSFDPATISEVVVHLPSNRIHVVDDRQMPAVCCQHLVAVALLDGRVTFASSHDKSRMSDRDVLGLRKKIHLVAEDDLAKARPERQSVVEFTMTNGERHRHQAKVVRGTPDDPMLPEEVAAKAADILEPTMGSGASALIDLVLTREFNMEELVSACSTRAEAA